MKKLGRLSLILLLAIATIFCVTACDSDSIEDDNNQMDLSDKADTKVSYEISVDDTKVTVDTNDISVCLYTLDGTVVGEKKLSQGKTLFELNADSYIATLSGVTEEVSYSSVLLTKNSKKATITLEEASYDEYSETNKFAFTIVVVTDDRAIENLDVQICDDDLCRSARFGEGENIADLFLGIGEYEVKVYAYSDDGMEELYHENYTITSEKRFFVILL